jgi:D-proline reductase (dithiol) PrdB
MGDFSEFSLSVRALLAAYRWRRIDPVPWSPPRKPLSESRLAIVSTAGLVADDQEGFGTVTGGDASFRVIQNGVDLDTLRDTHRSESFDHSGMVSDPNLVFPRDRLRELAAQGLIGSVAPRHLSFMGSITRTRPLIDDSAPAAASLLTADGVDAVLLVPV